MTGFIVVGTDTDAGKTAFSALFLSAFADQFAYWKPLETGDSDTATIRRLVPIVTAFDPVAHFAEAVAPMLAARRAGRPMPGVDDVLAAVPRSPLPLLIETFGGSLSPLTEGVLQIEWIRRIAAPVVLVATSRIGAVGRTLATVEALDRRGVRPAAIVLFGPHDDFADEQLARSTGIPVVSVSLPEGPWTPETLTHAAEHQRERLDAVRKEVLRLCAPRAPFAGASSAVWHPYTPLMSPDPPLPVVAAQDEFLTLGDGRTLIDGISSWWTILHGHRQPAIMAAIREATHTLDHVLFAGASHPHAVELAERLLAAMPWERGGRVFYSDNGSTAVEVALKMAYQYWCHRGEPQRTLFVGFEYGYHGDTFGAMSVGRDPLFFGRFEPLLFRAVQSPLDPDALAAVLARHRIEVAAVIVEPLVQGAGGMRMHSAETLRALADATRAHDVPLIADEVMTGFGRTGSLWAFQQAGIAPDLVCLAKGITGGVLPLAATLAAPHIVEEFATADRTKTFFHGHSFTANPIACAAAVASWNVLQTGQWKADAARIEAFWRSRTAALAALPHVREVRIRGLIAAVELDIPGGYLADCGRHLRESCLRRGVLLRPLGNVLYALPPLCTSDTSLDRIATAMSEAVRSLPR